VRECGSELERGGMDVGWAKERLGFEVCLSTIQGDIVKKHISPCIVEAEIGHAHSRAPNLLRNKD
jgi:hypothetical protein